MAIKKVLTPLLLVYTLVIYACVYVVLPEGLESAEEGSGLGWSAVATNVNKSAGGDLHIDLTIRNDTGVWSAMKAIQGKPAVLNSNGDSIDCDTVFVNSGGHRLAPSFQMRGYVAGTMAAPETQLIYVECNGAEAAPASTLSIEYEYVTGQYNYYEQDKNRVEGTLEIELDELATDLTYPIAEPLDGLVQTADSEIEALNKVVVTLTEIERTDNGLQLMWQTENPGEYPTYVHIGTPPVIGTDGILYGLYQTPDIVSAPITPAGGTAKWMTEVSVPADVQGYYILLSVESGKARLFENYVVDISDK